jgi:hypothetical protein
MANGTTPDSSTKKTNWADSDDDEDFIFNFRVQKNPRMISLEKEVAQ